MDQSILSTKKSRFSTRSTLSLRGRDHGESGPNANLRVTDAQCQALLVGVDMLLLLAGVLTAWWLAQLNPAAQAGLSLPGLGLGVLKWFWVGMLLGTWLLFGWLTDLYDIHSAHARGLSTARIVVADLLSVLAAVLVVLFFELVFPGAFLLFYLGIGLSLVIAWRFAYAALSRTSLFVRRVMILGTGTSARTVANLLDQEQGLPYEVFGHVSELPNTEATRCGDLPIWNIATSLIDLVRELRVDTIVAAIDGEPNPALYTDLIACQAHGIHVLSVPAVYHRLCQKVPVEYVSPSWLLEAIQSSSSRMRRLCKRVLDLTITLLALPWLLLALPLIAAAIKLDSPGPVIYRQVRSGLGGKPFQILKFRTMFVNAERDGKARWAARDDPRITRVGSFLRKLRLDEMPQFVNILRGDMSLIGPRPERPEFVAQLEKELPYYCTRLLVPPGLTGWAQIKYTYSDSVEGALIKLQYDVYYVHHWSVWMDIYILFQTVSVVLGAKGT
ncbi:MAG: sugar transferase [Caldilineaceae bacterium]|nr:sugar transferase [Caldilineaceae bacterium]